MSTGRAAYLDRAAVEKICQRGLALRGGSVDGEELPPARDILTDLKAVWVPGEPGQHWDTLAPRLADRFPDAYATVNPEALSALVRAQGIESRRVKVKNVSRRGVYLDQIEGAITDRAEPAADTNPDNDPTSAPDEESSRPEDR
jgi:DNA segregation ATPase FtsK/SpoIIIE, S-DNA-T family